MPAIMFVLSMRFRLIAAVIASTAFAAAVTAGAACVAVRIALAHDCVVAAAAVAAEALAFMALVHELVAVEAAAIVEFRLVRSAPMVTVTSVSPVAIMLPPIASFALRHIRAIPGTTRCRPYSRRRDGRC